MARSLRPERSPSYAIFSRPWLYSGSRRLQITAKGAGMDAIRRYSMLIDGDWVDTDDRFEIRSPATEELVASVAKGDREHADRAVLAAKTVHADGRWRRTPPAERAAVLHAIADR